MMPEHAWADPPPDRPAPDRPSLAAVMVTRVSPQDRATCGDRVAVETPVALAYNCQSHVVMMASPRDLTDFAYGFSIAEGIVASRDEILSVETAPRGAGIRLSITIPEPRARALAARPRNMEGRTGCGLCGIADIAQALRPLPIAATAGRLPAATLIAALAALPETQALNRETGAMHAAAFAAPDGRLVCVREDVGRHNALDKVIGAVARQGLDPAGGFVVVTSRCSMEMVQKTATFGCPVLVAISAPTSLAIELAEQSNLTVAAFARGARLNLYTHPERIV
ncbi:MAG: formate dehydrogenase accessory sulfurtransferase FdhD [Alphaproteobacteria bacterium]